MTTASNLDHTCPADNPDHLTAPLGLPSGPAQQPRYGQDAWNGEEGSGDDTSLSGPGVSGGPDSATARC